MYLSTVTKHARRIALLIVVASLLITSALSNNLFKASGESMQPVERSQEQIIAYMIDHPALVHTFFLDFSRVYDNYPSLEAPYESGSLKEGVYTQYLNMINQVRYIAGLSEVTLNQSYNEQAQAAALLNAINDRLSHYPERPDGMNDDLYNLGYSGASHANLGHGYNDGAHAVRNGWMEDSDETNISSVGHRRWILNPFMKETGFGQVGYYYAMYAHDNANAIYTNTPVHVAWPAKNMPISMFDYYYAWSYIVGRAIDQSEIDSLKVVLKNTKTGKSWTFKNGSANCYVDNSGYGAPGAIIFLPDSIEEYDDGDIYSVTITGLNDGTISYDVNFFYDGIERYQPVNSVELDHNEVKIKTGDSVTLNARIQPDNATDKELIGDCSDTSVCDLTIGSNSVTLTAKKDGQAEITVHAGDLKEDKCKVIVSNETIDPIEPTPSEPEETTPAEWEDPTPNPAPKPSNNQNGLADCADKDGNWWYYTNGKIDTNHNGVDHNKYGWWRVENGKVNFKAQGIYQNKYGWWKTTDGEVTFKENSIYQNEFGWWKCKDSKVDFSAQSIYQNQYGWWKTTDGKVTFKENGLFKNQYGTWKVENSKVNFNFNGKYQGKTIKNGKVV